MNEKIKLKCLRCRKNLMGKQIKFCSRKCQRNYYYHNKEGVKEKDKEYMKKYRIKNRESLKKYRKENGERLKELCRLWRERNKGHVNDWKERNLDKHREHKRKSEQKRRANLFCIVEDFTHEEWNLKLKLTKGICPNCKKIIGVLKLTKDHIYPVSIAKKDYEKTGVMRKYSIENVMPLCKSCNSKKHNKIINVN